MFVFCSCVLFLMVQLEPVSAPVEEEAPDAAAQESPVRTQAADGKDDDEEPMEHEESDPVIHEESDDAAQVRRHPLKIFTSVRDPKHDDK